MKPLKAQYIDDSHFRVLAIPFGGPLDGKDLDGEFFSPRTDIKPDWFSERPVLWHHGQDDYLGDAVIGKATDLTEDEDGWWVDVWLKRGQRYADLIAQLSQKAPLYGSSGTISYLKRAAPDGEILAWPYVEQTLTLTPSNAMSVTRPAKALVDAFDSADIRLDATVKSLLAEIEQLRTDLRPTSHASEETARDERLDAFVKKADDVLATLRQS
jgi:hypothetical protein